MSTLDQINFNGGVTTKLVILKFIPPTTKRTLQLSVSHLRLPGPAPELPACEKTARNPGCGIMAPGPLGPGGCGAMGPGATGPGPMGPGAVGPWSRGPWSRGSRGSGLGATWGSRPIWPQKHCVPFYPPTTSPKCNDFIPPIVGLVESP